MQYRLFIMLGLIVMLTANAQKKSDPSFYAKTINEALLQKHLSIIASAEMEGRNTPSTGLEKAADYITEQFKAFGLKPGNGNSYRQTYQLTKDSLTEAVLTINNRTFSITEDFVPFFQGTENVNVTFPDYVFAGYGIVDSSRNDYDGLDVKNKLVVIVDGAPNGYPAVQGRQSPVGLFAKMRKARELGAAAVLIAIEKFPQRMRMRVTYRPVVENIGANAPKTIPVFLINDNVVNAVSNNSISSIKQAIDGQMVQPGIMQGEVEMKVTFDKQTAGTSNIIGIVEGSEKKDEYLLVTGHYDHLGKDEKGNIYYGADDDGSGAVSVVALAKAFAIAKQKGWGPKRTIIFMTVSGEEKGLWGSAYYAFHPIYPLQQTTANLNIDMIGRVGNEYANSKDSANYVYIVGDDKLSTDLRPLAESINSTYSKMIVDRKYEDPNDKERIFYRSDHYSFASKGVPVIFYFDGIHPDYHKITDTVDKINFSLMSKRVQMVFYTAWDLANRNDMLKRDLKLN